MRKCLMSLLFSVALLVAIPHRAMAAKPKLVVNIVVSQMRYDYTTRFTDNLSNGGLRRFAEQGMVFTESRYGFMQTNSPAGLATLMTGANPSTHGVVGSRWVDYTSGRSVELIHDDTTVGISCQTGDGRYSPKHMAVPTVGDRLLEESSASRVVAVAVDPLSSVVLGGQKGCAYWMEGEYGRWVTSTAYREALPAWLVAYNGSSLAGRHINSYKWALKLAQEKYRNRMFTSYDFNSDRDVKRLDNAQEFAAKKKSPRNLDELMSTPIGNTLVTEFVKQIVVSEKLGAGSHTDMLNVCYDGLRYVSERYGSESVEVEDAVYRLDEEIAQLLEFLNQRVGAGNVLVVLTSDHGASDSYDRNGVKKERFNVTQFRAIMNSFLNAQYGAGEWVLDYCDRQLYINRDLVYSKRLNLEEVQNRLSAFVLQFRGVSHVMTSTAMQNSYFSGSYAEKMQNGFYPRRSGDITINLMPGWIEERPRVRSTSGSMYDYDTHVPLMILGGGLRGTVKRNVDMRDFAPTLAAIMSIGRPIAAEGHPFDDVRSRTPKE